MFANHVWLLHWDSFKHEPEGDITNTAFLNSFSLRSLLLQFRFIAVRHGFCSVCAVVICCFRDDCTLKGSQVLSLPAYPAPSPHLFFMWLSPDSKWHQTSVSVTEIHPHKKSASPNFNSNHYTDLFVCLL